MTHPDLTPDHLAEHLAGQIQCRPGFRRLEHLARDAATALLAVQHATDALARLAHLDEDDPERQAALATLDAASATHTAAVLARDRLASDLTRAHLATITDPRDRTADPAAITRHLLHVATPALVAPAKRGRPRTLRAPREDTRAIERLAYSQDARHEHNLIARALLLGKFIRDDQPLPEHDGEPRQPRPDTHSETMATAHKAFTRRARDTLRFLHRLTPDALDERALREALRTAQGLAHGALQADEWFRTSARAYERDARDTQHTGRYYDGSTFWIWLTVPEGLAPGTPDRLQFLFDLEVLWDETGVTLDVANAREIEVLSGVDVGPDGWRDLVAWLEWAREDRTGRPPHDDRHLVWGRDRDSLVLQYAVKRRFPNLPRALEGLRGTLRLASGDSRAALLGALATANAYTEEEHRPARVKQSRYQSTAYALAGFDVE